MDDQAPEDGVKVAGISPTSAVRTDSRLTTHGQCGKSWIQRGNRTGHCSGCHETFEGLAVFDAHRYTNDAGQRACRNPADVKVGGEHLEMVEGTWRGPRMPESEKERRRAAA